MAYKETVVFNVSGNSTQQSTVRTVMDNITLHGAGNITIGLSEGKLLFSGPTNYLTTAALSNHSHNFATTTTNGASIIVATTNSNGATIAVPAFLTTAQAPGAYLTTARASNDAVGLNTAQTNVTWTVNSSGISLNASGYAGIGTSATNASITLNSNGLAISVAAPGGGGAINVSAGTTSNNLQSVIFANANGLTFGLGTGGSSQSITASHNGLTTAAASDHSHGNPTLALTNLSGTTASASNGFTLSLSAAAPGGGGAIQSGYLEPLIDREMLAAQIGNNQLFIQPLNPRIDIQFEEIAWMNNFSNASNSSNSATLTLQVGIFTRTGNTLSRLTSASQSYAITASGTVGSYSIYGGPREYPIPLTTTLSQSNYWIGFLSRTTTGGGAGMTWSNFVASNINSAYSGRFSSANNATNQWVMGLGSYNTTTTAIPASINLNQINGSAAVNLRPVIYKLVSADLN